MDLEKWLKNLILRYRENYQDLTGKTKEQKPSIINFLPPCQIEAVWIENKSLQASLQVLIITHWEDYEDLKIQVNGPIDPTEAFDYLEEFMKKEEWEYKDPKIQQNESDLKILLKKRFIFDLKNFRDRFSARIFSNNVPTSLIVSQSLLSIRAFCWTYFGQIQERTVEEFLTEHFGLGKDKIFVDLKSLQTSQKKKVQLDGFCTLFYPYLWVENIPELTIRESVFNEPNYQNLEKVLETQYKGQIVIVMNDGLIGIVHQDKETARKLLNEILGAALLLGHQAFIVRKFEMGKIKIDANTHNLKSATAMMGTLRANIFEPLRSKYISSSSPLIKSHFISASDIGAVIKYAEKITKDKFISDNLKFLLEARSLLYTDDYSQSFHMSWIIIEKYLDQEWEDFIQKLDSNRKRRDFLQNKVFWGAASRIEVLNFCGLISNDNYKIFTKLRNIRNDIIHAKKEIACTKENSKDCLKFSRNLLLSRI